MRVPLLNYEKKRPDNPRHSIRYMRRFAPRAVGKLLTYAPLVHERTAAEL